MPNGGMWVGGTEQRSGEVKTPCRDSPRYPSCTEICAAIIISIARRSYPVGTPLSWLLILFQEMALSFTVVTDVHVPSRDHVTFAQRGQMSLHEASHAYVTRASSQSVNSTSLSWRGVLDRSKGSLMVICRSSASV